MVEIGLDIGTSNCCVCIARPHPQLAQVPAIEVVPSTSGTHLTPSYVAFAEDGHVLVGDAAKAQLADNTKRTFYEFKRVLGLSYAARGLWNKHWTFTLSQSAKTGDPVFAILDADNKVREYTALELYTILIQHLLERARSRLAPGESVDAVTVTVPAHFGANQRKQTKLAVEAALKDKCQVQVIDEPVAAVVTYVDQGRLKLGDIDPKHRVMVFDLGGGTLDVTLLKVVGADRLEVCTSEGQSDLGGIDFDTAILDHVCNVYQKHQKRNLRADRPLYAQARRSSEEAKITLSTQTSTSISAGMQIPVTRAEFGKWINKYLQQASKLMQKVLDSQRLQASDVSHVIVVGGSSQVPAVRSMIAEFFHPHPVHIRDDVNPTESVAQGAAIHAFHHLRNPQPDVKELPQTSVVSALSSNIGIRLPGDVMHVLLRKNAPLPCEAELPVYPVRRQQTRATVRIYQGPHALVTSDGMASVGTVEIPLAAQSDCLTLTMRMDVGGMLGITLKNSVTGQDISKNLTFS